MKPVYQECMEIELGLQGILFVPRKPLTLEYKGTILRTRYEPDLVCFDKIIVELKAVTQLVDEHRAQVQNYLKATGLQLGLLVNFGHFPSWSGSVSSTHADDTAHRQRADHREGATRTGEDDRRVPFRIFRVFRGCLFFRLMATRRSR